jgi:ribosomal protein S9
MTMGERAPSATVVVGASVEVVSGGGVSGPVQAIRTAIERIAVARGIVIFVVDAAVVFIEVSLFAHYTKRYL